MGVGKEQSLTAAYRGQSITQIFQALKAFSPQCIWESAEARFTDQGLTQHAPGRYSFIGFGELGRLLVRGDSVELSMRGECLSESLSKFQGDPLCALKSLLKTLLPEGRPEDSIFGAFGSLAYDAIRYYEKMPCVSGHALQPDAFFIVPEIILRVDNQEGTILLSSFSASLLREMHKVLEALPTMEQPLVYKEATELADFSLYFSQDEFVQRVETAKEYVRAGDAFQIVLSNVLSCAPLKDPLRLYEVLKNRNPSPFHFYFKFDEFVIVGASPEVMFRSEECRGGRTRIYMRPVAGTYAKGVSTEDAKRKAESLIADEKERAEHVMLVDHVRNDIGRVSEIGSVHVDELCAVETYSAVHHIVSEISGVLREKEDVFSAFSACFPIATMTGTPKLRAMEIIAELEGRSRGIYAGAFGYFNERGHIDSCVAIRFAISSAVETLIQVGAGIVADSVPEKEFEECLLKARALLQAMGGD